MRRARPRDAREGGRERGAVKLHRGGAGRRLGDGDQRGENGRARGPSAGAPRPPSSVPADLPRGPDTLPLSRIERPDAPSPTRLQSIWAGPPSAPSPGSEGQAGEGAAVGWGGVGGQGQTAAETIWGSIPGPILFQAPAPPRRSRAQPHSLTLPAPFPGGSLRLHLQILQWKLMVSRWTFASHLNIVRSGRRLSCLLQLSVTSVSFPRPAPSLAGFHRPCLPGLRLRLPGRRV